ncbi:MULTISPECIES: ABC transporter permease [unclassified Caballeronia]|uniref:ABC transporter permease n=1 Tax=unclassified Caballeronia TaxID=2646786 RepID=UPI002028C75D|nr:MULTISPECIES: ABC transporter permease [unclassified Caballeronia]MDR5773979.1 ABC transporter permease [Caballeronia sp. LZ002]MDR5800347.1 ABC transporter permease [Caballeronia sp. LZ001]MDR5849414.1 ABC transporter permease [Caballeronia sp. LZ003]
MKKNLPILIALAALLVLGVVRYEHFASEYNVTSFWRYNSMFALISIGMAFVIITGGIDLSVGAVAALASVVAALASPHGGVAAVLAGSAAGLAVGLLNGLVITHLRILPFIVTLATSLGAHGLALLLGHNDAVAISSDTSFANFGQGDLFGLPIPGLVAAAAAIVGWIALRSSRFGRHALAIGGSEEASRLMGLNVDRTLVAVYAVSGLLAGIAGAILAAQFGAGQPNEGIGWELFAISAVVLGGTRLTGGDGSIAMTIAGVALLGLVFNLLNFENGLGYISLSAYWQSVIRGLFLLLVIVLQARVLNRKAMVAKVAR